MKIEAGLLPVDKPEGPTSHDLTALVRRVTGVRRIGHTGTLDPIASGLLLLCVGWATRLAEYLTGLAKSYRGVIRLGERTDTDDREGRVTDASNGWRSLETEQVRRALDRQIGLIEQIPPAYSAKKVAGRRAYAVAREGGVPELRPQLVTISRIELLEYEPPDLSVEIECSSGTYIRSVARDLGESLGVGAHLRSLRRTRVGSFAVEDALRVERETPLEAIVDRLLPPEQAVGHMERADLDAGAAEAFRRGLPVEWNGPALEAPMAVFLDDALVGIGATRDGCLQPRKVFGGPAA
jgi:tRNA pseudouridine55 synthase